MKKYLIALCLVMSGSISGASANEKALLKFYGKHYPKIQSEYLQEVVRNTEKWAARDHLTNQVDTFLSMGHRESTFNPFADDRDLVGLKKHSVGLYQTRADYRIWLRNYWLLRGYTLGPDDSLDTQCAFGIAEFRVHLNRAGGNVWGGVRRYNGAGQAAREYARKVMVSRRIIFRHPYEDGESVVVWDSLKLTRKKK